MTTGLTRDQMRSQASLRALPRGRYAIMTPSCVIITVAHVIVVSSSMYAQVSSLVAAGITLRIEDEAAGLRCAASHTVTSVLTTWGPLNA